MTECSISPIIIFDGGYDKSGRKLKTIFERIRNRLSLVKYIAANQKYERVLPILAREAFISVLTELNIPFAVADYEADDQITVLANYYECPVISADSDFYIYDLHYGFITRDSLDTTITLDTDANGNEYKFLNCDIYHIDDFVSCFPGIEKSLLPLFSTLAGNDYVEEHEFHQFFSNIQLPKYKGVHLNACRRQKKLVEILCWLRNNTVNTAIDQVTKYLKKGRREYIRTIIEDAITGYELRTCNLLHIINRQLSKSENDFCLDNKIVRPCGELVPLDFTLKYHKGDYSQFLVNVIVLHKVFLHPQIEDIASPSSYTCSNAIRKVIYGILVHHDVDGNMCQNEKCLSSVEEYDRKKKSLQKELVEPTFFLDGFGVLPTINDVICLKKEVCQLILMKTLEIELDILLDLPHEWQLVVGSFNYCLRKSKPHSTEAFVYALIINLIYYSLIKPNSCSKLVSKYTTTEKSEEVSTNLSIESILTRISELEIQNVSNNLKKYLSKPTINHGNPLLVYILHSYSQLQGCVLSAMSLNKLLGSCMKNPDLNRCFSGTLIYNLAKDISTRSNPKLFVAEILGRRSVLFELFTELLNKVCHEVPSVCVVKKVLLSKKSKKKHSRVCNVPYAITNHAINQFDVLNDLEAL